MPFLPRNKFTGNAAHELRTPPGADAGTAGAFCAEHPGHAAGDGRLFLLPAAGADRTAVPDDKNPA